MFLLFVGNFPVVAAAFVKEIKIFPCEKLVGCTLEAHLLVFYSVPFFSVSLSEPVYLDYHYPVICLEVWNGDSGARILHRPLFLSHSIRRELDWTQSSQNLNQYPYETPASTAGYDLSHYATALVPVIFLYFF